MSADDRTWIPDRPPGDHDPEPTLTERVERVRELGRGGMGVVWLGVQSQLGREVAVKTLQANADPLAWQSLVREGRIAARLEHPNIVPVHDLCLDAADQPQLVMKRLEGRTWSELIHDPRHLPVEDRADPLRFHLDVLRNVCRAVEYAHAHDVLHRDLKPSNVMVGAFGEVTVLDWGAAVSMGEDAGGHPTDAAAQSTVIGTPQYMAPEMFQSKEGELGPASDLYLLGGMLLEVLTGQPPRPPGTIKQHRALSQEPLRLPASLPSDLRAALARVLQPDPAQRGTVAAFRQVLERHGAAVWVEDARQRVQARIDALDEAIASGTPDDVLRMYGEVRYGLEALHEQGESLGLELQEALLRRMVQYALDRDEVGAARLLLSSAADPSPALVEAVEDAAARVKRYRERMERLERLLDTQTGRALRGVLGALIMAMFLGQSLLLDSLGLERGTLWKLISEPTRFLFVAIIVMAFWPWLRRSHVSRQLSAIVLLSPVVAMPVTLAMWWADLPSLATALATSALSATLTLLAGVLVDRRLVPAGLLYIAAIPIAAIYPAYMTLWFMVPTVAIGVSLLWMWRGDR